MSKIVLSHIRMYPIKGCAGMDVREAFMDGRGLQYDRRWMLINEQGQDLHQFDYPRLASIVVSIDVDRLFIQAPAMPPLRIPLQAEQSDKVSVQWFEGSCEAVPANSEADQWFQTFLHAPCRLVLMPEQTQRFISPEYSDQQSLLAFTSFPYHLLGEGSLADLNQRLEVPVPLDRFRPNLVVAGAEAFAEDHWHTIAINHHVFQLVKPCGRCAITTVDPVRGVMTGKEPMKTLAAYRTVQKEVLFGQYLISETTGTLHVGDPVEVLAYKD